MDVHVPAAITRGLRRRKIDVLTAQEDGAQEADDGELLDRATALGRLIFSMDQDFLAEATRRWQSNQPFATVVFARPKEITIGRCVNDLEIIAAAASEEDLTLQVLYLPL